MKKVLGVFLVVVLLVGVSAVVLAQDKEGSDSWKDSWRRFVAKHEGVAFDDVKLEGTVWQFANFIGNSRKENFLSLIALTNFNLDVRTRIQPVWIPSGASYPIYGDEITLDPFQVTIIGTDVNGRISGSNGWAAFYSKSQDDYFGMSVVLICTNPNFMGLSVIPGDAYLF